MIDSNPTLVPTAGSIESAPAELTAPVAHVILVHGIGEISPGAVMDAAIAGITAALPDVASPATTLQMQLDDRERDVVAARIRKVSLNWGIHAFTLTEFQWADEARKMRWKQRPIDATLKFVEMIGEVPSLGLRAESSPFAKRCARYLGWALRVIALCIVIGTILLVLAALGIEAFELIHENSAITRDHLWFHVVSSVFLLGSRVSSSSDCQA